ncbi:MULTISPECIES: MliC family protein [Halomonadaceae]|uniref:Membrane-bound lysozyme-inhibitor of c-type lysozyme n=1 Tax=Vreelandella subterranea TaxID=416874 RepID=A0A1H9U7H6_9GAMM|nr:MULTISPECIES: MliC family protein [Halomonas]OAZ90733.1 C-type lysozyme, inhibitor [Halomonas sp. G11]SES05053.1 Membrane-bound lysozyme-inhibitor of c-type lysozyme [Halomonas subterranea]
MMTPSRFFVLGCAFVAISGCAAMESPSSAERAKGDTGLDAKAPLFPSALFSGQAEQFEAWHCRPANQHLVTAVDGDVLRLWSLHGAWRLPQAIVASGARYQDGEISFWNRGEQALVETPRGQLKCELAARREASTREEHPGVMFRGQGNEPGWTVELAHDAPELTLSTDYGENVETLPYMVSVMDNDAGRVVLENADADDFFRVRIEAGACFDGMSGHPFPARVTLTIDGEQYSGCGQGIAPSA